LVVLILIVSSYFTQVFTIIPVQKLFKSIKIVTEL